MSKETIVTIFHFDDEPETVDWIPEALLNYYWLKHPSWVDENTLTSESQDTHTFVSYLLKPSEQPVRIRYCIYRTAQAFKEAFIKPGQLDLVLLDLITENPDGALEPVGVEFYRLAVDRVTAQRVYVHTAYPRYFETTTAIYLPAGHLIAKPANATATVHELVRQLESVLPDGSLALP
jgi:hypothetical protein